MIQETIDFTPATCAIAGHFPSLPPVPAPSGQRFDTDGDGRLMWPLGLAPVMPEASTAGDERPCAHCGSTFAPEMKGSHAYCSLECNLAARKARDRKPPRPPKPCAHCSVPFIPKSSVGRFCSEKCCDRWQMGHRARSTDQRPSIVDGLPINSSWTWRGRVWRVMTVTRPSIGGLRVGLITKTGHRIATRLDHFRNEAVPADVVTDARRGA